MPAALEFHREQLAPRRARCRGLLDEFRPRLGQPLTPPGNTWFSQMASVELPPCDVADVAQRLSEEHRIDVVVHEWNGRPLLRLQELGSALAHKAGRGSNPREGRRLPRVRSPLRP